MSDAPPEPALGFVGFAIPVPLELGPETITPLVGASGGVLAVVCDDPSAEEVVWEDAVRGSLMIGSDVEEAVVGVENFRKKEAMKGELTATKEQEGEANERFCCFG